MPFSLGNVRDRACGEAGVVLYEPRARALPRDGDLCTFTPGRQCPELPPTRVSMADCDLSLMSQPGEPSSRTTHIPSLQRALWDSALLDFSSRGPGAGPVRYWGQGGNVLLVTREAEAS